MATFRQRNNKWQARVQKKGYEPVTKSFNTKADAIKWATQVESKIDKGIFTNTSLAEKTIFTEVIDRYLQEVVPHTKSAYEDSYRLRALARKSIGQLNMMALTPTRIAEYRDIRLQEVSAGTVIRELAYFSSIINYARKEWGINIDNPVQLVRKPPSPASRERTLSLEEQDRLFNVLKPIRHDSNHWMLPIVKFALETAMRRGEILSLKWVDIDLLKRTAHLQTTKNGDSRTVPLSTRAVQILQDIPRSIDGRVFQIQKANLHKHFTNGCKRAEIKDLHFHDLRHTAITNMASKFSNILELSAVTGHRQLSMLKRYYHPRAEDLALKLG
jgi:integrase